MNVEFLKDYSKLKKGDKRDLNPSLAGSLMRQKIAKAVPSNKDASKKVTSNKGEK